ncbi:MAG: N-acetyltransferase family protein [Beijerinckiaceae bacterium]
MERSALPNERIRRLWPSDVADYREHLLRLDSKARYSRFCTFISDDVIIRHAEKCFGPDCLVYGLFVDGVLRAAAELHVFERGATKFTGEAEAAFSVEKDLRHKGVGSMLMERVIRGARNRGLRKVVITCLPQNFAMQSLARKFGAELSFERDEVAGQFDVRIPTVQSIFDEIVDDSLGFATAILDLQNRILHPSLEHRGARAAA